MRVKLSELPPEVLELVVLEPPPLKLICSVVFSNDVKFLPIVKVSEEEDDVVEDELDAKEKIRLSSFGAATSTGADGAAYGAGAAGLGAGSAGAFGSAAGAGTKTGLGSIGAKSWIGGVSTWMTPVSTV